MYKGDISNIRKGVLISMETGTTFAYSLNNLQARGILFVNPGIEVYENDSWRTFKRKWFSC